MFFVEVYYFALLVFIIVLYCVNLRRLRVYKFQILGDITRTQKTEMQIFRVPRHICQN